MDGLTLLSQRDNIEEAFKSLIKSGRPDIRDDENKICCHSYMWTCLKMIIS